MTEHIDGLYTTGEDSDFAADILYQGEISSGYGSPPAYSKVTRIFYEQGFTFPWFDSTDFDEFFTNPQLIAPINLIKWED